MIIRVIFKKTNIPSKQIKRQDDRAYFSLVSVKSLNNVSGCSDFPDLSTLIKVSVYLKIDHSSENCVTILFF